MHAGDAKLPPLRHEFGDTKHRAVTYTVTGTSRFRQYFADDEPDAAFRAWTTLPVTPVPSSAQPIPPVILGIRPAFSWELGEIEPGQALWDDLQRTRRGGRLRIELARPWFTTGAGEQLAVLRMVLGRDPVWSTPDPDGSPIEAMTVHQVWRSGDSWYADIETPPTLSYAPFARLTVARHQPNSLSGLELSDQVDTDIARVLPDRTLIVQRQDNALHVELLGIGPSGPRPNRVDAFMERGPGDAALTRLDSDEAPSWQRVPGASASGPLNTALPPLTIPKTGDSLRIYVREVEQPGASPGSGELAERVVFADYVHQFPVRE